MNADPDNVIYFNNCHGRDHFWHYGPGAFFDLDTTGRQSTQATNLNAGQICVVGSVASDGQISFNWYSFRHESILNDRNGQPGRVFFGDLVALETMAKRKAARSVRYRSLFRQTGKFKGEFKIGSVFHGVVPQEERPKEIEVPSAGASEGQNPNPQTGGYGSSEQNKLVETAAINAVRESYENDHWQVDSVEREKCGYDLDCRKGRKVEHVEVKGVSGTRQGFIVTANEFETSKTDANFVLAVVTSALSTSPTLTRYSGAQFHQEFNLSVTHYRAELRRRG